MSLNLQNTINFASPFIQYAPVSAGLGGEPAISIASMIRNSILGEPMTWYFNRAEKTFSTVKGQQDYDQQIDDLAFVEKVSLADDQGNLFEVKDVYNTSALGVSSFQQRPSAMSIESRSVVSNLQHFSFRFLGVPDAVYTVTVIYQKISPQFGPFFISSVANASAGNTAYTGTFDSISFPVGATAVISGFTNAVNNGSFVVVSCTATTLTVANAAGVAETKQGYGSNFSWDPIPDRYSDVYNNLFLAEILALSDDARAQVYRQRGVAALMSKAAGLTEMQKNIFMQQWLARGVERTSVAAREQLGTAGRGL